MDPNETTGEELRGTREVVHEANCTRKLEREGNKRGSIRSPQHKQAATAKSEAEENEVRYYGHIRRKGDIIQTILEGRMEGRRRRGRPGSTT